MRIPLIAAAVAVASAAAPALAAPPSCDKILDDGLRRSCQERMERCEPLKTAAERDECYRGPRSPRGTPLATAGAPVSLVSAAPAPAAAPQSPAPQAPVREASVKPAPQPPAQQPNPAPPPAAPHPTVAQPVVAAPPAAPRTAPKPGSAAALPPTALAPTSLTPTTLTPRTVAPAPQAHAMAAPPAHAIPAQPAAPAAMARPAAMAAPPRPAAAAPAATPEQVVRTFYDALSRADGAAANSALIPEKRGNGAYEPAAISRYYGAMREPLRLLGLTALEPGMIQVRYTYTHASGRRCDGAAEVAVSLHGSTPLIERIKALNGC